MNSELTTEFIELYNKLQKHIKTLASKNYKLWKNDPTHPGLYFKKIKSHDNIYSIRIGAAWRAIGVLKSRDSIIWFWIGSHNDYDKLLKSL
ncbi:MAG: hypothetical protein ABI543_15045 [Ignavibacteria bacterium]